MTFEERATTYRPEKGDFECDLQTKALGAETLQALNIFEPPEVERHASDYCSELGNKETPDVDREMLEVEVCANELWDLRGPEPAHVDDHEYNSQVTVSLLFHLWADLLNQCLHNGLTSAVSCCKG